MVTTAQISDLERESDEVREEIGSVNIAVDEDGAEDVGVRDCVEEGGFEAD